MLGNPTADSKPLPASKIVPRPADLRVEQYAGLTPVKSALVSEDWAGFGIVLLDENLMKGTPFDVRAFLDPVIPPTSR